ncbi:hypothetical protein GCM10009678_72480 [Actinomadura kijaniata]|uniref:Uncharacterized protein n=1 Tax=Actinomadura namibiensis TaxID=182080 RepID=A0A7W3LYA7_ACTNM|nr:hypothetical protein [Actinomadura namibiensis]MBA8956568.1 hypothetical protein [Actinomadura namibiensis]
MINEAHGRSAVDHAPSAPAPGHRLRSGFDTPEAFAEHHRPDRSTSHALRRTYPGPTDQRLLRDIARPVHSGIAGAFANDWLRAAFVEALVSDERLPDVITTRHDLDLMFCGQSSQVIAHGFNERLHVFEALEEVVEHLEAKADDIRSGQAAPTTVWFATPGDDADVIHQTIEYWAGLDLIALFHGNWSHGPNRHPQPAHRPTLHAQLFTTQPVSESIALLQQSD